MIKNKQVNLWRGPDAPPTLYHIWLKDESQLLRYDEEKRDWIVFLDSTRIVNIIDEFLTHLDESLSFSINGKPVKDNPILTTEDIKTTSDGNYIKANNTIEESLQILDALLTTQVYDDKQ